VGREGDEGRRRATKGRREDRRLREYRGKRHACGYPGTTVAEMRRGGGGGAVSALSRAAGTVLADRFPANNWKCKRNRPPRDSSIIESLISV